MTNPVIGVLALQGAFADHAKILRELGVGVREVRTPAQLATVDGLVIPGGESTTIWKLAEMFELAGPLREWVARGMPVFGSCAGMIMLAARLTGAASGQETFGAIDVTVQRNAFGRQIDSFEQDLDIAGIPGGPVRAVFIRAPIVAQAGGDVRILAEVGGHPVAVQQDRVLAISFHPELVGELRLHRYFLSLVRADEMAVL